MAAKILITGATGAVGRELVRELVQRGKNVRCGIHQHQKSEYIKMTGVEGVSLEYGDFATIDRALQEIETIFLLMPFAREQVEYARRMIDRAALYGVNHVVYVSMLGAQEYPGTSFTRWHYRIEKYLEKSSIPYTILRPNMYMQNFVRYVQPSGSFIYLPLNSARVSYIDVRDVASVAAEIILAQKEHFGNTYELTGPDSLTLDDIADILTSVIGTHIGYINISTETARHIMETLGTPQWMAEGMLELYSLQRAGKQSNVSDITEQITNRKPNNFEQFARDYSTIFKAIIEHEHHIKIR
ncbi:MAG: SDR family oxidoreductase [Fibrobacter sp.]|nr:SDR family oxidoreductase [Fibrobacter sp.]